MFEIAVYCQNCGQTLTLTVDKIERGGLRLVCYVKNHICFGGYEEHKNDNQFCDDCEGEKGEKENSYIGNAWYGPYGSLVCDVEIDGVTNLFQMSDDSKRAYGADYLIAETMPIKAAAIFAENLGLKWRGRINE